MSPRLPRPFLSAALLVAVVAGCGGPAVQDGGAASQAPRLQADTAFMADGTRLPVRYWTPDDEPRAVALALHGFNDYGGAFEALGSTLAEQGILTVSYDQRGFGATEARGIWPGEQRLIEDARAMLALLREAHPEQPLYIIGKSMGGGVTLAALARDPLPEVDGAVLVAPAVWARRTMPWYQRTALWVGARVAPGRKVTGRSLGIRPTDNMPMLREWGRDPLVIRETRIDAVYGLANLMDTALAASTELRVPTLILYGANDEIVPRRPTCRMLQGLPDNGLWDLVLYPDGYHMLTRDLQGQVVIDDIAAWLLDRHGDLPSGLESTAEHQRAAFCETGGTPDDNDSEEISP